MTSHDTLRQRFSSLLGRLLTNLPFLARRWGRTFAAITHDDGALTPMRAPLHQSRLALVTTGGVHLVTQLPFNMADSRGDPSFRVIPADTPRNQLMITHDYYDHRDADQDLNILLPLALGQELAARGILGGLGACYSFMGHIEPPHVATLMRDTAPQIARMLQRERIDAVVLTPA